MVADKIHSVVKPATQFNVIWNREIFALNTFEYLPQNFAFLFC